MKKIFILLIVLTGVLSLSNCKSEVKKEEVKKTKKVEAKYSLKKAKNQINFTAFKTTEKIPVGGQFKKVDILSNGEGETVKDAINNAEFSIPVSSLFTKDSSRDFKIRKFFFGVMENTKLLSGKLVLENDSLGYTTIKMNGLTSKIPFKYTISNNSFSMNAKMDVTNWNALSAIESLNKACFDLHKGADGVTKTWNEVLLNITSTF